jgi:DNA helicase-2/ATP-dependent DNA helicase PcrA
MKTRIENTGVDLNYVGTFHSISLKIINEYDLLGYSPHILEGEHKLEFFKESVEELKLKETYIEPFLLQIEKLKRNGLFHEELVVNKSNKLEVFLKKSYELYENALIEKQMIDYEDMLLVLIKNIKNNKEFVDKFKHKFEHILIDEYQDSSLLQLNLIREMLKLNDKISFFAVGDDDQSIYGFRDAKIENILRFGDYFKDTNIIKLIDNYRSSKEIVEIANSLIKNNKFRYKKKLGNIKSNKGMIDKKVFMEQSKENNFIINKVKEFIDLGKSSSSIAILLRYNYQIKNFIPYFKENNIEFTTSLSDEEKIELELDNSGNGIKIITYHSAKGLEFETVFLPYLGEEIFLRKDSDIEEERRLFYVGITRAEENLFLTYSTTNKRFGQTIFTNPLPFLKEIE